MRARESIVVGRNVQAGTVVIAKGDDRVELTWREAVILGGRIMRLGREAQKEIWERRRP